MADKGKDKEEGVERIYVVPLRNARKKSSNAAPRAVKEVRKYLVRHMKVETDDIWIDDSLNRELWSHGKFKIPSKIRIRAVKFDDGVVEVSLPELGFKQSRREFLKEEREKKTPILKTEEMEDEEGIGEGITGAEDYEVTPTSDGEVKIKKKKAPKKEGEKKAEKKPAAKKKEGKTAEKKDTKPAKKETSKKTTETKKAPAKKKTPAKKKETDKKSG